jgi:hypothetical protein
MLALEMAHQPIAERQMVIRPRLLVRESTQRNHSL